MNDDEQSYEGFTDWKVKYEEQPYTNDNFYDEEDRMISMIEWFIEEGIDANTREELIKAIDEQTRIIYESVPLMEVDRIRSEIIKRLPVDLQGLLGGSKE